MASQNPFAFITAENFPVTNIEDINVICLALLYQLQWPAMNVLVKRGELDGCVLTNRRVMTLHNVTAAP
jgi:hypothetical protein